MHLRAFTLIELLVVIAVIALLIGLWLLSGQLGEEGPSEHPTLAEENRQRQAQVEDDALTRVRARVIQAVPQVRTVVLRGRTENKRTVEVKAETAGRIVWRPPKPPWNAAASTWPAPRSAPRSPASWRTCCSNAATT